MTIKQKTHEKRLILKDTVRTIHAYVPQRERPWVLPCASNPLLASSKKIPRGKCSKKKCRLLRVIKTEKIKSENENEIGSESEEKVE